jgi:hypothetical protein
MAQDAELLSLQSVKLPGVNGGEAVDLLTLQTQLENLD